MKKLLYSGTMLLFSFVSISQNVEQIQTPLVVKKTATWCNPCGTWGWTWFEEFKQQRDNVSVMFEMHESASSGLFSQASLGLYSLFDPRNSTPIFYVNAKNEMEYTSGGSVMVQASKASILNAIDSTIATTPIANTGISYTVGNNTLNINTKVKFFQQTTGEYYINVYLAEENVQATQNGQGSSAIHKRVLRAAAYANAAGVLVVNGNVVQGAEYTGSHSIPLNASWNTNNFYVFVVIWKKVNDEFHYVNSSKKGGSYANINEQIVGDNGFIIYPNVIESGQPFNIELSEIIDADSKVIIFNQVGQMVKSINVESFNSSNQLITIEDTRALRTGMYFVMVTSKNGANKKVMRLIVK